MLVLGLPTYPDVELPNKLFVEFKFILLLPEYPRVLLPNMSLVVVRLQLAAIATSWSNVNIPTFASVTTSTPASKFFITLFIFFSFFIFIMKFIIIISSDLSLSIIYYIFYNIYLFCNFNFDGFIETSKGGDIELHMELWGDDRRSKFI